MSTDETTNVETTEAVVAEAAVDAVQGATSEGADIDELKLLSQFSLNAGRVKLLTHRATTRQLGRVMRALNVAPLIDETGKFNSDVEKELYQAMLMGNQVKQLLMQSMMKQMDKDFGTPAVVPEVPSEEIKTEGEGQ